MSIVWPDLTRPVSEESELLVWPITITYNFLLEVHRTWVVVFVDAFVIVVECYCHCRLTNHDQLLIGRANNHGSWVVVVAFVLVVLFIERTWRLVRCLYICCCCCVVIVGAHVFVVVVVVLKRPTFYWSVQSEPSGWVNLALTLPFFGCQALCCNQSTTKIALGVLCGFSKSFAPTRISFHFSMELRH